MAWWMDGTKPWRGFYFLKPGSPAPDRWIDTGAGAVVWQRREAERKESRQMGVDGHLRTPRERHVDCEGVCVGVFDVASDCGLTQTGDRWRSLRNQKERKYSQKLQHVGIFAFVKLSGTKKGFDKPPPPVFQTRGVATESICWTVFTERAGGKTSSGVAETRLLSHVFRRAIWRLLSTG